MTTVMEKTLSQKLVDVIACIRDNPLPEIVVMKAKTCLLDFLAASYSATDSPLTDMASVILRTFGPGNSSLLGRSEKSGLLGATVYNGMIATAEDVDDAHRFVSGLHLGAVTFPALLALGEERPMSGERFIKAAAAGYEIASRIGRAIESGHRSRGFHATGTVGPFGACAASSLALELDRDKMVKAQGIAGSTACGLFAFLEDGSTVRHAHAGLASAHGLLATCLAEGGLTGPARVLEAGEGFLRAYSETYDLQPIERPLDREYEITCAYHKLYASCGHAFPAIDAALSLKKELNPRPDDIEHIEIRVYKASAALNRKTAQTVAEAKFSIPFLVGIALIFGDVSLKEMTLDNLHDPRVIALAPRVGVVEDRKIAADFPRKRSAELIARLSGGKVFTKRIEAPLGMPENPVSCDQIEKKFMSATAELMSPDRQSKIIDCIRHLENLSSIEALTRLLA